MEEHTIGFKVTAPHLHQIYLTGYRSSPWRGNIRTTTLSWKGEKYRCFCIRSKRKMIYQYAINIEKISDFNQLEAFMELLSKERITKIMKYYFTKDKIRSLLAEALVRYALYKQYDLKDMEIQFCYSKYGKPSLRNEKSIHFNLSHAGEWVVCAVGDTPVGIDVEVIRDSQLPSAHQCFSVYEIQLLKNSPEEYQAELFYKIWTLKESFVKYNGKGLNDSFDTFSFDLYKEIKLMEDEKINLDVSFLSIRIDHKHWYALCVEKSEIVNDIEIVTLKELLEKV